MKYLGIILIFQTLAMANKYMNMNMVSLLHKNLKYSVLK